MTDPLKKITVDMRCAKFLKRHPVKWHLDDGGYYLAITDANGEMLLYADLALNFTDKQLKLFREVIALMVNLVNREFGW